MRAAKALCLVAAYLYVMALAVMGGYWVGQALSRCG